MCIEKATCPLPEIVTNGGRQVKGTKEGDFVVFYCQPNYELVGERRANCTRAGLWSHPTPKCIRGECVLEVNLTSCMYATAISQYALILVFQLIHARCTKMGIDQAV